MLDVQHQPYALSIVVVALCRSSDGQHGRLGKDRLNLQRQ